MSKNFDWQSLEDEKWPPEPNAPQEPRPQRRWPWLALVGLLTIVAAGWFLYRQVNEQVTAAETAVQTDLLASHNLMLEASNSGDAALFLAILSGSQPYWVDIQEQLVVDGRLWDRTPFGLTLAESTQTPPTINLTPDLREAEVTFSLPYETENGIVELQHTAVYRRGSSRWLYSPPKSDFWGSWITNNGNMITLIYPQRDAEIAEQLAFDLDEMLRQLCSTLPDIHCPGNLHVLLRLHTQPDILAEAFDLANLLPQGLRLALPTPSLLGLPQDDAGYTAVYHGYARQLALAVIANLVNYECCEHGPFFRAMADWQLVELGLLERPLTPDDYEQLLQADFTSDWLMDAWRSKDVNESDPYLRQITALVAYWQEGGLTDSLATMQRDMDVGYVRWVNRHEIGEDLEGNEWFRFIYQNSISGQTPPPPLPQNHLNMICRTNAGQIAQNETRLYDYDFDAREWHVVLEVNDNGYVSIAPLLSADTYFVSEYGNFITDDPDTNMPSLTTSRSYVWQHGEIFPLYEASDTNINNLSNIFFNGLDPQERYMGIGYWLPADRHGHSLLVDLQSCTTTGCEQRELPGWPIWSPDGTHMLMQTEEALNPDTRWPEYGFYLADADGQNPVEVGLGARLAWLGTQAFGYIHWMSETEQELVTAAIPTSDPSSVSPQTILTNADLLPALPSLQNRNDTAVEWLNFSYFLFTSTRNGTIIIIASNQILTQDREFVFLLHDAGQPTQSLEFLDEHFAGAPLLVSPDGRWLTLTPPQKSTAFPATLTTTLINLDTGERQELTGSYPYLHYHWSQESDWLIQSFESYALLYAPSHDYRYLVTIPMTGCEPPFWGTQ